MRNQNMELLIPGLVSLLFAVAIAFYVMPTMGPPMLVAVGLGLLIVAEYVHWSQFGVAEYEKSTWQNNLRRYGSLIVLAVVLLAAYGFYTINQGGSSGLVPSVATPALPEITAPTVGGSVASMAKTVSSRIRELMRQ